MIELPELKSWILYATCEVTYTGRATSTLELGNYLIVYKKDHSLSIHGGTLIIPRNYMSNIIKIIITPETIIFATKREQITIKITMMIHLIELNDWSEYKTTMRRTEKELVTKIIAGWESYFPQSGVVELLQEYPTTLGPIDILGKAPEVYYVIEVKRKLISLKDVTQLLRYVEALLPEVKTIRAYIVGPAISANARKYLNNHSLDYLKVDFDD